MVFLIFKKMCKIRLKNLEKCVKNKKKSWKNMRKSILKAGKMCYDLDNIIIIFFKEDYEWSGFL